MKIFPNFLFFCVLTTQIFLFTNTAAAELIPTPSSPLPTQHLILYTNDENNAIFTEQMTNMQEFTIPKDTPKRPGYLFCGWATLPNAEIAEYQPGERLRTNAELFELYAVWRPEQAAFILLYNANGGSNPPEAQTAAGGSLFCEFLITDLEPQRLDFDFIGWSLTPDAAEADYFPGDIFFTLNKQNILYAVWQEKPKLLYTLVYNAENAENIPAKQNIEANSSGCTFQLSDQIPRRSGFIFLGWAKTPGANQPEYQPGADLQTVCHLTMLYAVWQKQNIFTYTLFFEANGGTKAPPKQTGQTSEPSYTFTIPAQKPQRFGYIFLGWSQTANAKTPDFQPDTELTIITEQLTLYAVWQQQTIPAPDLLYTLVYHANGGSNTPQTQLAYSNNPTHNFKISSQRPQRSGYSFLGWNTTADSTYAEYQPGDDFLTSQTENILFAV